MASNRLTAFVVLFVFHHSVIHRSEGSVSEENRSNCRLDFDNDSLRGVATCDCHSGDVAWIHKDKPACVPGHLIRQKRFCEARPCLPNQHCEVTENPLGWKCISDDGRSTEMRILHRSYLEFACVSNQDNVQGNCGKTTNDENQSAVKGENGHNGRNGYDEEIGHHSEIKHQVDGQHRGEGGGHREKMGRHVESGHRNSEEHSQTGRRKRSIFDRRFVGLDLLHSRIGGKRYLEEDHYDSRLHEENLSDGLQGGQEQHRRSITLEKKDVFDDLEPIYGNDEDDVYPFWPTFFYD